MTLKNNFVYEDVKVFRKTKFYLVEIEEYTFYIRISDVEDIAEKNAEDVNLIAIILGYIEYARTCRNASIDHPKEKKLDLEVVATAISVLLKEWSIDIIIDYMKDLKWYEIVKIVKSGNPIEEIKEII